MTCPPQYISRMDHVSTVSGNQLARLLVFSDQPSHHDLGTLIKSRGKWCFFSLLGQPCMLGILDLRTIAKQIEHLNAQATEERVQKAQAKNRH
jgi:hypothetical protein